MKFLDWALALLSGLLLFLSFPKYGTAAVAWLAAAPLLVAIAHRPGRQAFRLGFVAGLVANLGIYYWIALVIGEFGGISLAVSIPLMVLMATIIALFPAIFAWAIERLVRAHGTSALLLAPFVWVALEFVRSHTLLRFAWCLLGYSQSDNLPFLQIARLGGVYAVSFVLVAGSAVLAYAVVERAVRPKAAALLGLLLLLFFVFADGQRQLGRAITESGRVRLGLVQANIPQDIKWDPDAADKNVEKHVRLTDQATAQGARFVIWPESAVPGYYDELPYLIAHLGDLARRSKASILFGNDDRVTGSDGVERYFVGAKTIDSDGVLRHRYHKLNLVPFGEYVPLHSILTFGGRFTARLTQAVSDFTPGSGRTLGEIDGHKYGAFICYEAIYPDLISGFALDGAELLVNITNDAWYGYTSAPYQHFEMARVRAVESGRYLVRAANTGISAVVDPRGRVLARTGLFEPAALVLDVPFVATTTLYTRIGDVFAWLCVVVAVGALLLARRPSAAK